MKWLITIIVGVLRALLPLLAGKLTPTAEDAKRDRNIRERLRERIRRWWHAKDKDSDLPR